MYVGVQYEPIKVGELLTMTLYGVVARAQL